MCVYVYVGLVVWGTGWVKWRFFYFHFIGYIKHFVLHLSFV